MADTTRDYSSIYGVKDFIINDMAPNYFDNLEEMSTLNVGLLGLTTDITATVAFDSMQVVSRYSTEIIPGQASLPDFIYAHANNFGITDLFAQCSTCRAVLIINQDYILENGVRNGNYIDYTISDDIVVYIEDIPFMIPYPIRIRSSLYGNSYNHKCTYVNNGFENPIIKLTHPFIKCTKLKINGESSNYIAITVTLCQYYKTTVTENIITNNKLNIPYIDVNHNDPICNFEVFYKAPDSTEKIQLTKLLETTPATTTPFAYYKLIDENTYRIFFSSDDRYFIPEYNSELEIVSYQTTGSSGKFPLYKGNDIFVSTNDGSQIYAVIVSASEGGVDAMTLDNINKKTWEAQTTIKSYTTDADLNQFFTLTYSSLYDSTAYFIKIRDDFVDRVYACYIRLKNDIGIFPTNTLNCHIYPEYIDTTYESLDRYIINAGSRFIYLDDETRTLATIIDDDADAPLDGIEYTNIGLISISKSPNSIAYYMNSIDKDILMSYTYLNDNSIYQFIMSEFRVNRDAVLGDNTYTMTATIVPSDLTISQSQISDDSIIDNASGGGDDATNKFDPTLVTMIAFFRSDNNSKSGHYVKFKFDEDNSTNTGYIFKADISSDDLITDKNIQLTDLTPVGNSMLSSYRSVSMQNPPMQILTFYDENNTSNTNHDYQFIPEVGNLVLTNIFEAEEDEMYFAYPLTVMKSTVTFKERDAKVGDNNFYFDVKDVPLFSREFLQNPDNLEQALARIDEEHSNLINTLDKITSNFSISLRFFNTYGRSRTFTISDGKNSPLNRTNCDIALDMKFSDTVDIVDTVPYVKRTIKDYVESLCETTNTNINMINISTLLTRLHDEYPNEIEYIVFKSINGYDPLIQSINMEMDLTESKNCNIVPEFLNLSLDNIYITEI